MEYDQNIPSHSQLFGTQFQNGDPIKIPISPTPPPEISAPEPQPEFADPLSRPELPPQRPRIPSYLFIIILFILAILLGAGYRLFGAMLPFQTQMASTDQSIQRPVDTYTPSPTEIPAAEWTAYQVLNGTTKKGISGFTFKLPANLLSLVCDGSSCASQGTFLSGGTRFTVAAHGKGQILPEIGKVFTDISGQQFTTGQMVVGNMIPATGFSGTFTGTTYGGFSFDQMRGALVQHGDVVIELNHFTPKGVMADFEKDDVLFDSILSSIQVEATSPAERKGI